jgi:SAM-dependent methyltransferase
MYSRVFKDIGWGAVKKLGIGQYFILLGNFFLSLPAIMRERSLNPLDKKMGRILKINYCGYKFGIDCGYADDTLDEKSYTFGAVRELYLRNCYLKHHDVELREINNVVDLGCNRGVFSLLAANFAEKVVSVDAQTQYADVYRHNMKLNNFSHCTLLNTFIGDGGALAACGEWKEHKDLSQLMLEVGMDNIDFLKLDIEGSEYEFFRTINCLDKIRRLSMEVHLEFGDLKEIISCLENHDFSVILADRNLKITNDVNKSAFLYATNENNLK